MTRAATLPRPAPPALAELKARLAETLARSRLDYTDEIMILAAFLTDLHQAEPVVASRALRHWKNLLRGGLPPDHRLRLELVFPFCEQKCLYCNLGTKVPSRAADLARYVRDVEEEIAFFAPTFAGTPFQSFWVGRGTPSILAEEELRDFMGLAFSRFRFDERGTIAIECSPASMTAGKARALREAGFNQISFGVESLNPAVLRLAGRHRQDLRSIEDSVRWSAEAGFDDVNLDLVLGLAGDGLDGFLESFRGVAALRPTTITVCSLGLTDAYMKVTGADRDGHLRRMQDLAPKAVDALGGLAGETGYGTDELSPDKGVWRFVADDTPPARLEKWERSEPDGGGPSSLLALGLRGRSHVFGRALYQRKPGPFDRKAPVYRSRALTLKEEMSYCVLQALNGDSRIDAASMRRWFGVDVAEAFAVELGALRAWGKVREDARGIAFLPVRAPERIFYASVFLLDSLAESPFSRGRLDGALRARLRRELEGPGA